MINAKPTSKPPITLHGIFGSFDIPKKSLVVKYFSTRATRRNPSTGEEELLRMLKPMRDILPPSQLNDISSLLQRDLNDSRIAEEIVPYLIGEKSEVVFFPAILAVLVPKDFLRQEQIQYPEITDRKDEPDLIRVVYGEHWELSTFKIGEPEKEKIESCLAELAIYSDKTQIIVLDGQHRANAFRVVTGTFNESGQTTPYDTFYQKLKTDSKIPQTFIADLPVTLIWFEDNNRSEIKPNLVSRKLFVDVNQSAKQVSESRKILLNDYEMSSLFTRFFYTAIITRLRAEKKELFETGTLSLLHSGFDHESELSTTQGHAFGITNPQIMRFVFFNLFWGSQNGDDVSRYEATTRKPASTHLDILLQNDASAIRNNYITKKQDDDADEKEMPYIKDISRIKDCEEELNKDILPAIIDVFSELNIFAIHFQSSDEFVKENESQWTVSDIDTWKYVFCGGEGLYYSLSDMSENVYRRSIPIIEKGFKELKAKKIGLSSEETDTAFQTFVTKAFQVGLFMALYMYKSTNASRTFRENARSFITDFNKIPVTSWITIFTEIKNAVIGELDPKKWAGIRNLILRFIQDGEHSFYTQDNYTSSPEFKIFANTIKNSFDNKYNQNDYSKDDIKAIRTNIASQEYEEEVKQWATDAINKIATLYNKVNKVAFAISDPKTEAIQLLKL